MWSEKYISSEEEGCLPGQMKISQKNFTEQKFTVKIKTPKEISQGGWEQLQQRKYEKDVHVLRRTNVLYK